MADSLKAINNIKINKDKLIQLQVDFDILQKDEKIKVMRQNQLLKELQFKKQKHYLFLISILLIIAVFSTLFFLKINKEIKFKNTIIENNNIALENTQSLLKKSLSEKEVLLKEIHHRVKNNMQLVISLLKIQSLENEELTIEEFINVSEIRINSMALIHENLYKSDDINKVNIKEYLVNLSEFIINSHKGYKNIKLNVSSELIYFDIQTAVPLGLIINELINNAYKHAFLNKETGTILLKLSANCDNYKLLISDNGIGIKNEQKNAKSLGMELVKLLVLQIKGIIKINNTNGTTFTITFKI